MGKAAVNLPDPLGPSDLPSNAQADDLLSQLAGEQIDQLLHDAPPQVEGPKVALLRAPVVAAAPIEMSPPIVGFSPPFNDLAPQLIDEAVERRALVEVLDRAAEEEDELPRALRALEWINAPFGAEARQTLGRLGILLLLNAAGVIVYVLIFGRG